MSLAHQTAYSEAYGRDLSSLDERIFAGMHDYLVNALGLPEETARARSESEIENRAGRAFCSECENLGIALSGRTVLDLGAGLGGVSLAAAQSGARVLAVEPGDGWRNIAHQRLALENALVLGAYGEALPAGDGSIDVVVSMQVLEHVQNPERVIAEVYRVLKPGGVFFFSYENYLGFWEPHYRVRWLPLLPKSVGAIYLRALGRDPRFLMEAVTYTTFPAVRRYLRNSGFECGRERAVAQGLQSPEKSGLKWKILKSVAAVHPGSAIALVSGVDFGRRLFRTAIYELMYKPHPVH